MADAPKLVFAPFAAPSRGVLVVFCDDGLKFGPETRKILGAAADLVQRAAKSERFAGKSGASLDLIHPEGLKVARLSVVGIGKAAEARPRDVIRFGGAAMGKVPAAAAEATIVAELPGGAMDGGAAADLAQGVLLRAYAFDRYKTRRKDEDKAPGRRTV